MEDDKEQRPESLLPYEAWTEAALRQVVGDAIAHAAARGMPGAHHFYVTFRTDHPGVVIPPRLRSQYRREMTIVLQHQFWDLTFDHEARLITVGLSFGGVPATLAIPLDSVIAFADPHVHFGLRFQAVMPDADEPESAGALPAPPAEERKDEASEPAREEEKPQVVSLDAFRRRTPPKE